MSNRVKEENTELLPPKFSDCSRYRCQPAGPSQQLTQALGLRATLLCHRTKDPIPFLKEMDIAVRVQSGSYLSTGWFTFILAMDACYGIHVYGMINDTYCKTEGYRKVPYHYYEQGRDECDEYFLHEHAPYGGHRFITEKKVFAKWAKKHRIIFTHPNWTVS
ncbi:hypothetical protein J1605_019288 [Eschrichtius robustus]|uniref:Alpha-N-acetylgalactosaminide alpha-2,6-sialyltransferase 3 n=1 Tax=Eschrichtius robustus TaxID=9764 RepID=A0AB34HPR1_ESCRO|nr:hypothetical protein J1605_019288 [Eschrichtius robustus]MBW03309.1 Alpha-N-acetylgalactosaminide alpha-2,6-sialyltransferase 3 [Eschrichtius robustus]